MREITELIARIVPIIDASLECTGRMPNYFTAPHIIHNLQLATMYWRDASQIAAETMEGDVVQVEGEGVIVEKAPAFFSTGEALRYIQEKMLELRASAEGHISSSSYPRKCQDYLKEGLRHVVLADYNLKMTKHYNDTQGKNKSF